MMRAEKFTWPRKHSRDCRQCQCRAIRNDIKEKPMIALRPARPHELTLLWELRTRAIAHACAAHYRADVLAAWLASSPSASLHALIDQGSAFVAEEDGRLLGYAALDTHSGEVEAVFVEPDRHGHGIGALLMQALLDAARTAGCRRLFLSASLNAVPFYERVGFAAVREELYPHRSGIGIPSVFMEMQLG
jgi:GNAT superfamily N-acetyltransferase